MSNVVPIFPYSGFGLTFDDVAHKPLQETLAKIIRERARWLEDMLLCLMVTGTPIYDLSVRELKDRTVICVRGVPLYGWHLKLSSEHG